MFLLKKTGSVKDQRRVPQVLLLTVKSSGFSVITALSLFGEQAAVPSAVFAIIVLLYLLFLTSRMEIKKMSRN